MKQFVFTDLVDVENLKEMMKVNYLASGIPVGIFATQSGEMFARQGCRKICTDFHENNETLQKRCAESRTEIESKIKRGEHFAYKCKNGLWEIGIPVFCLDEHIATIFLGQFFYEGELADREFFISQASRYGLDADLYLEALGEVPVVSRQKIDEAIEYNKAFAEFLSNIASKTELLRRKSEEKHIQKALADSEQRLADIIDFLPDPTWVIDNQGRVIAWNRAIERLTGIKKNDILGRGDYAYAVPFWEKRRPVLIDFVLNPEKKWEKEYLSMKEHDGILIESESFHPHMGDGGRYLSAMAGRLYNVKGDIVGAIESVRDITARKHSDKERERLIAELQEALAKVRTLSGMLPICSKCKKIRDDKGYWNQIEIYIRERSEAEFSHGICPECAKLLYPDWV
jgi:PAS domain S-box-containing protein